MVMDYSQVYGEALAARQQMLEQMWQAELARGWQEIMAARERAADPAYQRALARDIRESTPRWPAWAPNLSQPRVQGASQQTPPQPGTGIGRPPGQAVPPSGMNGGLPGIDPWANARTGRLPGT